MNIPNFFIEPANFETDFEDLRRVRNAVFVDEQRIPPEIEFDEHDRHCHHQLARNLQGEPIGTGRLSPEGKIGRLAVLSEWRGQGVGKSLLRAIIEQARGRGLTTVSANAQVSAQAFYEKFAFTAEGEEFLEAGIPHRTMRLTLAPPVTPQRPPSDVRAPSVAAVRLENGEAILAATVELIAQSRRQLYIHSRDLEFGLYGHGELVEALKQFALRNRGGEVRIIVQEPASLRGKTHPLLELTQKLTSFFLVRAPVEEEDLQYPSSFVINDRDGYLFRLVGDRLEGHWSPNLPARHRQLQEAFERAWQRSRPCSEFRALGL